MGYKSKIKARGRGLTPSLSVSMGSAEETISVGRLLGECLTPGQVVALRGPLGAGKTTLIKGIALGLGVADARDVKSPTFVLIKEYAGRCRVAHVDFYRLERQAEAERIDVDAYLNSETVCLIEWADKFPALIPSRHLRVRCEHSTPTERRITFTATDAASRKTLRALRHTLRRAASP